MRIHREPPSTSAPGSRSRSPRPWRDARYTNVLRVDRTYGSHGPNRTVRTDERGILRNKCGTPVLWCPGERFAHTLFDPSCDRTGDRDPDHHVRRRVPVVGTASPDPDARNRAFARRGISRYSVPGRPPSQDHHRRVAVRSARVFCGDHHRCARGHAGQRLRQRSHITGDVLTPGHVRFRPASVAHRGRIHRLLGDLFPISWTLPGRDKPARAAHRATQWLPFLHRRSVLPVHVLRNGLKTFLIRTINGLRRAHRGRTRSQRDGIGRIHSDEVPMARCVRAFHVCCVRSAMAPDLITICQSTHMHASPLTKEG